MDKIYLTDFPCLLAEWDYEKNIGLLPETLTHGSGLSVWWKCLKCGYSWKAKINNRTHGRNCPVCSNKKIIKGINDLATTHPNIAQEWDYERNGELTPYQVSHGSGKKVYWICPNGHSYQATILHRTCGLGTNCPVCNSGRQTSFAEQAIFYYVKKFHPDAINRYNDIFSNGMELDIYIPSIHTAIEYDGIYWHKNKIERETKKYEICHKHGIKLFRVKGGAHPQDDSFNKTADITVYVPNPENKCEFNKALLSLLERLEMFYRHAVWHKLDVDIERDKFEIRKYMKELSKSSLESEHPDIALEWNEEKNNGMRPSMFSSNSSETVWWTCSTCGHVWKTSIYHRTHGTNCPSCYKANNVGGNHPEAKKIYQYTINGEFIREWPSISDATRSTNINTSNISMCAKHKRPVAGGYRWEYEFYSQLSPIARKERKTTYFGKPVLQCDADGNLINEFSSLGDAEKQTGINATSISKAINGHIKTAGGFYWKKK